MFNDKRVLITGGTGTFGTNFTKHLLNKYSPKKVVIFSRDEMKQWDMENAFQDQRLRFMLGDIRDKNRLQRAFSDIDFVVHAAAMKIVPKAEYDPFECIKTNVIGAMNIIDAAIDNNVNKVVALSTDKASSPINVYGASKLLSDKIFSAANAYTGAQMTSFCVVRYGNVMGSRGSVIPLFLKKQSDASLPITDPEMTRFMINITEGIGLVETAFNNSTGGEIFVKKVPSIKLLDIAKAIHPNARFNIIGLRPGEKIHEQLISRDEAPYTFDFGDYYKIYSPFFLPADSAIRSTGGKRVEENFSYSSDNNKDWMDTEKLRKWINENKSWIIKDD